MKDVTGPDGLHVVSMGEGPREVLAVHCTLAQSGAWKGVARGLSGQARVTAFDLPGHGRSADWDGQGDLPDAVARMGCALLDAALGTAPRVDLVGHSFGAIVALRMAQLAGARIRTLTLIEPVLMCAARGTAALADIDARALPMEDMMARGDLAGAARHFNAMWSDARAPAWTDLSPAARAGMIRAIPLVPACNAALYHDSLGFLAPGGLDALACPVQLIRGSATDPVIGEINDQLAARLPGAENKIIAGAGHMVPITHSSQTAAELSAFFARHPA